MSGLSFGVRLAALSLGIGDEARRLEAEGFDFLVVGEHVSFNVATANSFISLAAASAVTRSIGLMSAVTLVPLYPVGLLAKMISALDNVSGGRFVLGAGLGGENPAEFAACGVSMAERGHRADEALAALWHLWGGRDGESGFRGLFASLEGVHIEPPPISRPHPPIWVAGRGPRARRRAASYGDGWIPYMYTPDMLRDSLVEIRERGDRATPIEGGIYVWVCSNPDAGLAERFAVEKLADVYRQDFTRHLDRYLVVGDPDRCVERLLDYVKAGARRIILNQACPDGYLDTNRRIFADTVIPRVRQLAGADPAIEFV